MIAKASSDVGDNQHGRVPLPRGGALIRSGWIVKVRRSCGVRLRPKRRNV
jgi:hypothetical protein